MKVALILVLASAACQAEIIDRVAVVVGNGVITESEVLREIRLTAFLNGEPMDFSAAARRKAADRLVERRLIRTESNVSLYAPPEADAIEQMVKDVQARLGSRERYQRELERTGLTEEEVKAHLRDAVATLRFLDFRFRPGMEIGEDEIRKYFQEVLQPQLRNRSPGSDFALSDYHKQVEDALIAEHVDKASDAWLKETRDHTRIEFRSAVFSEPNKQEASK